MPCLFRGHPGWESGTQWDGWAGGRLRLESAELCRFQLPLHIQICSWEWEASEGGGLGQAEAAGCPHPAPLPPAPSPPGSPSDLFVFPLKGGSPALCGISAWDGEAMSPWAVPGFPAIDTDSDNESKGQERQRQGG